MGLGEHRSFSKRGSWQVVFRPMAKIVLSENKKAVVLERIMFVEQALQLAKLLAHFRSGDSAFTMIIFDDD